MLNPSGSHSAAILTQFTHTISLLLACLCQWRTEPSGM